MTVLPGVATLGLVPVPFQSASSSCEREGRGEAKEAARVPIAIALCAAEDGKQCAQPPRSERRCP